MPHIQFLRDHQVKAEGGASYKQGDIVECSVSSAEHFTRRHIAVVCDAPKPKPVVKPASKPAPKKKDADDEAAS